MGQPYNNLKQVRKDRGFKTAEAFVDHNPRFKLSTYRRYESNPEHIPVKAAIWLSEKLHTSTDVILGVVPYGKIPKDVVICPASTQPCNHDCPMYVAEFDKCVILTLDKKLKGTKKDA